LRIGGWWLLATLVSACGPGDVDLLQRVHAPAITDGTKDTGHPSVGMLLVPTGPDTTGKCTATLVGERSMVTAAHCLVFAGVYKVSFEDEEYFVERAIPHPAYEPDLATKIPPPRDIGVVILEEAPLDIERSLLNDRTPQPGTQVELVGFGNTQMGATDGAIKRKAVNVIEKVTGTRFSINGTGNGEGNVCQGDSGGPSLVTDVLQRKLVAGVTSATEGACGSRSWMTRVDAYRDWLLQAADRDLLFPDREPPEVTITSPAADDEVKLEVTVRASVSDRSAVTTVELLVDGTGAGSLAQGPYTFSVELSAGSHALEVRATDALGLVGRDRITVTAKEGGGGGGGDLKLGEVCTRDRDCADGLCHEDLDLGLRYCSRQCDPAKDGDCPEGFNCKEAAQGKGLCTPPGRPKEDGCTLNPELRRRGSDGPLLLLLLALVAMAVGRRGNRRR
jgi:hypothetical protein